MTGTVKSTPLAALQALTMNNPLKTQKMKTALILLERLIHFPYNSYWSQYKYHDRNLKTQNGFMQK
jgi:hypothetical protein